MKPLVTVLYEDLKTGKESALRASIRRPRPGLEALARAFAEVVQMGVTA